MARVKEDTLHPQQKLQSTEKRSTKTNRNMKLFFQHQKHWLFSGRNRVDLVRRFKKNKKPLLMKVLSMSSERVLIKVTELSLLTCG